MIPSNIKALEKKMLLSIGSSKELKFLKKETKSKMNHKKKKMNFDNLCILFLENN